MKKDTALIHFVANFRVIARTTNYRHVKYPNLPASVRYETMHNDSLKRGTEPPPCL